MGYSKKERAAIKNLSLESRRLFEVFEETEQGKIIGLPELCDTLDNRGEIIIFSCLSGNGKRKEIDQNLGTLFQRRKKKIVQKLFTALCGAGYDTAPLVIIDDCEPSRVWQWNISQEEITCWCEMIIEAARERGDIPEKWKILLWSRIERDESVIYDEILEKVRKECSLWTHQHLSYMRKFPNRKLVGDIRGAAKRRVAEYALQGILLEKRFPKAILLQSEVPWRVKDPLYNLLRGQLLPIIHPLPERR